AVETGFSPENRGFRPHITLARLQRQNRRPNLPTRPGTMWQKADRVYLLHNRPDGSEGSLYETLAEFPLEGGS
ncbi:MAG: RNA 2',3'-cyclic phosphodiesterase, partial [Verrucomicrobiota bacterium]